MELIYSNIIIFLLSIVGIIGGYYKFILTAGDDEDKRIKLAKHVLILIVLTGIIHLYSITEDLQLKSFFVVLLAIIINTYSVIHSTKQCNFPNLYVFRLVIYSAIITIISGGILWYTTSNTLFGFMVSTEENSVIHTATNIFTSKLINGVNLDGTVSCPDPNDADNYTTEMNNLNTGDESDKLKYNACLEKEIRADLKKGI